VERSFYRQTAGFAGIKLDVIDDAAFGCMLKLAGAKQDILNGIDEIELEWYPNLPAFVRGIEKNGFAIFQFSLFLCLAYTLAVWSIFFVTLILPVLYLPAGSSLLVFSCFALYLALVGRAASKAFNFRPFYALTLPLSFVLMPLIYLRSAAITLKNGGIRWRGTFYPLSELKDQQTLRVIDLIFSRSRRARTAK
jgi:hypothetical protein